MGSAVGAEKAAASRTGLTLEQYRARVATGQKWCTTCKSWRPVSGFGKDRSRRDGRAARCVPCHRVSTPLQRVGGPTTQREATLAIEAVRAAIRRGELAPVTERTCACGKPAKHYHHHRGYDAEHRLDVAPLCVGCHRRVHLAHASPSGS